MLAGLGTGVSAAATTAPVAAAAPQAAPAAPQAAAPAAAGAGAAAAASCAPVLFEGARGSGEPGPGTKNWRRTAADPYGLGAEVNSVYRTLRPDLAGRAALSVASVNYAVFGSAALAGKVPHYFQNIAAGVTWTTRDLARRAAACPHQQIVLAGFSQGAMIMHRALRTLQATASGRAVLARVTQVILIGDGDQVPADRVAARYGTAPAGVRGVGLAYRKYSGSSTAKLPAGTGARVLVVCTLNDPVCDWTGKNAGAIKNHLHYAGGAPLTAATTRTAGAVLTKVWAATEVTGTKNLDYTSLDAVTCSSVPACTAVGYFSPGSGAGAPVVLTGSGRTWKRAAVTLPGDAVASDLPGFMAVSCHASACVAVGDYDNAVGQQGLIGTGSGNSWHTIQAPLPANAAVAPVNGNPPTVILTDVACPAAGSCAATGHYLDNTGAQQGLLLTGSGNSWTAAEPPLGAGDPQADLSSVACSSATSCTAVGWANGPSNNQVPVLITWDGVAWTVQPTPLPPGVSGGILTSVSCAPAGGCGAVGEYFTSTTAPALLVTGSGATWQAATAPQLDTETASSIPFDTISCPVAGWCLTAGARYGSRSSLVVYAGYGTHWTATSAGLPPGGVFPSLGAVACASRTACVIAGQYGTGTTNNTAHLFLLVHNGASWLPAVTPMPGDAMAAAQDLQGSITAPAIAAAACRSASSCVLVGSYPAKSGSRVEQNGLLETGPA